jgi:hypothetical protein
VMDYIHSFNDTIVHVHWHDNNGNRDELLPIGAGLIDHQKAFEALKILTMIAQLHLRSLQIVMMSNPPLKNSECYGLMNVIYLADIKVSYN